MYAQNPSRKLAKDGSVVTVSVQAKRSVDRLQTWKKKIENEDAEAYIPEELEDLDLLSSGNEQNEMPEIVPYPQ